jgi:prepilin-type N-terminal cleavage/methylation domain-containing protein
MNSTLQFIRSRRPNAFTLTELMVAMALMSLVSIMSITLFATSSRMTRAGGSQVKFTNDGRLVSQEIAQLVEAGKAIGVSTAGLDIVTINLTCARIALEDLDSNPLTVKDNSLVYIPDTTKPNEGRKTLCSYVSAVGDEPIFSTIPSSPSAAKFVFHIGDSTNVPDTCYSGTGLGYQGLEIRFSATPRNLQRWYDENN